MSDESSHRGLSLRCEAHGGINSENITCLRHHLVTLRPAKGDESRKEDSGDLSDREETERENAHCENAASVTSTVNLNLTI